jgi:serine/threonine protein kinase
VNQVISIDGSPDDQDMQAIAEKPTAVEESAAETDFERRMAERGLERLIANYRAIIEARAIYYPVAYRFVRELGRGRQGIVFLGLRHGARGCLTRHAIKLFDPSIYASPRQYWTDMGRIAAQISRLQSVNAPNLVGRDVYDEENGIGYVQMEAIDGLDLQRLLYGRHFELARSRCSPEEWARFADVIFRFEEGKVRIQPGVALYIMRSALRGLEALHDAGFVHCDVKPSNIMVDMMGNVKVVDYGRANIINERSTFLLGSPLYMAPEIHRREPYQIPSDIYSLGLVGLELLRGESLVDYSKINEAQLLEFKMNLPRRLPDMLPPHVRRNKDFVAVLQRFLDPDPAKRYQRCDEAESSPMGLALLHKQLTIAGKDSEYYRDLESYMSKLQPMARPPDGPMEGLMA